MADHNTQHRETRETFNEPTACVLCSQNCGLLVDTVDGRIEAIRSDQNNPFSNGYTCNKAYRIGHYVEHEQRLRTPLKRQPDGSHAPISWEQATREIGEKLARLQSEHGSDSLAFLGIGGQGNHLSVPYALAFLASTGSKWWFNALAQEKTQRALVDDWMLQSPSDVMSVGHLEEADYALILGSNPAVSQRGPEPSLVLKAFQRSELRKLVVVDPRATETARRANEHIAITVGTDAFFLMGVAAVIVKESLYARDFVDTRTVGMREVKSTFGVIDVDAMAARSGVETSVIETVAREFAAAKRASIEIDLGLEQSRFNTLTAYLIRLMLALTNNMGRDGGSVFVSAFTPRVPSGSFGRPVAPESGLPGIALMAPVPMFSPNLFAEEVLNNRPDRIRAAIVEGSNPILQYADRQQTYAAFDALDLSVVIEVAFTETCEVADYVLPAPVGYEKWEFSGFPKPYPHIGLQVRPPVVPAPEGPLPEAEIYHRIALAMDLVAPAPALLKRQGARLLRSRSGIVVLAFLGAWAFLKVRSRRTIATALFWIYEALGPALKAPQLSAIWLFCQGVAWTRRKDVARALPETRRIRNRYAVGNLLFRLAMENPGGVILGTVDRTRNLEGHIGYSDGKIRLAPQQMMQEIRRALAAKDEVDPEYPFILNGGMRTQWTANANFRDPAWRKGRRAHCVLRMHPLDADPLGISDGDVVSVRTRRGRVELPAKFEEGVQRGHIHIPNGFGTRYPDPETGELRAEGVCINDLTDSQDRDPFTGCPHFKYVRCRVDRIDTDCELSTGDNSAHSAHR